MSEIDINQQVQLNSSDRMQEQSYRAAANDYFIVD